MEVAAHSFVFLIALSLLALSTVKCYDEGSTNGPCTDEANWSTSLTTPVCDQDGNYNPKQCDLTSGECWCVEQCGAEIEGTRDANEEVKCRYDISPCNKFYQRPKTTGLLIGGFKPRCQTDGFYYHTQCLGSSCYCVDRCNNKVPNTTHHIARIAERLCECPDDNHAYNCRINPCQNANCGNFPDAECRAVICGGCIAEFSVDGSIVDCGPEGLYVEPPLPPALIPECTFACVTIYEPVCGIDGDTYSNVCELNKAACENNIDNVVDYEGPCVSGCIDRYGNPKVEGDRWEEPCGQCTCYNSQAICPVVLCAGPPHPLCEVQMHDPNACCDSYICPEGCVDSFGMLHETAEEWQPDACTVCICPSGEGLRPSTQCAVIDCPIPPSPLCTVEEPAEGECCPTISCSEACIDKAGNIVAEGERYRPADSCTDCICLSGRKECPIVDCPPPQEGCPSKWEEGACCPTYDCQVIEPELAPCTDSDGNYKAVGETWYDGGDVCIFCTCALGNVLLCAATQCSGPPHELCTEEPSDVEVCCPNYVCPQGCLDNDGNFRQPGETWQLECQSCSCPEQDNPLISTGLGLITGSICQETCQEVTDCIDKLGKHAADGETYRPANSCVDCICIAGESLCPVVDCVRAPGPGCVEKLEEGACCPTYDCVGQGLQMECVDDNGNQKTIGEKWNKDSCTECTCTPGGFPLCLATLCSGQPHPFCILDPTDENSCCPNYTCPQGCLDNNSNFRRPGETWQQDPCQDCSCPEATNQPTYGALMIHMCSESACPELPGLQCHKCYYSETNGLVDSFITDDKGICYDDPSSASVVNCVDEAGSLLDGQMYRCFSSEWDRTDANGDIRTGKSHGCIAVQTSSHGTIPRTSNIDDIQMIFGFQLNSGDTQTGTTDFCDVNKCNIEDLIGLQCHKCYYSETNEVVDSFITDDKGICYDDPSSANVVNCVDEVGSLLDGQMYRCFSSEWDRTDANGDIRTGKSRGCIAVQTSSYGTIPSTSNIDDIQTIFGFQLSSGEIQTGTATFCDMNQCNKEDLIGLQCHKCYYSETNEVVDSFITDDKGICYDDPSSANVVNCVDEVGSLLDGQMYRCFSSEWDRTDANGDIRTGKSRGCIAVQTSSYGTIPSTSNIDDIQTIFGFQLSSGEIQTGTATFCDMNQCNKEDLIDQNEFVFSLPHPRSLAYDDVVYTPYVLITTPSETPIEVTVSSGFYSGSMLVSASQPANITLPETDYLGEDSGKFNNTVIVRTDGDISVHGMSTSRTSSDGFWVRPTNRLDNKYLIASYPPIIEIPKDVGDEYTPSYSEVSISALDAETKVTIIATDGTVIADVLLQPYETYQLLSENDLTGAAVEATHFVSVMSGSNCAWIPKVFNSHSLCGMIIENLPGINAFGSEFVLAPFMGRDSGYIYRVIAAEDSTSVTINGDGPINVNSQKFYEGDVTSNDIVSIVSDKPVLVVQYSKDWGTDMNGVGAPSMIVVPSTNNFINSIVFPVTNLFTEKAQTAYITIIINCSDVEGLLLDDSKVYDWDSIDKQDKTYCALRKPVPVGIYKLSHQSANALFSVQVYGFSRYNAYSYDAGYSGVSDSVEPIPHAGQCPPSDTKETAIGICANTCNYDDTCTVKQKCCPTACGGFSCIEAVQPQPQDGPCTSNRCQNGGTCRVKWRVLYACSCKEGFSGINCETQDAVKVELGPCYPNPCFNGGTCAVRLWVFYRCTCAPGVEGGQCETMECPPETPQTACFDDPCAFSSCLAYPSARCLANYCGGCNALYYDDDGIQVDCNQAECPPEVPEVECFVNPCDTSTCPANPSATCVANYCGGCYPIYYDDNGNEVDCFQQGCMDGDKFRLPGEVWKPDRCQNCFCPSTPSHPELSLSPIGCQSEACPQFQLSAGCQYISPNVDECCGRLECIATTTQCPPEAPVVNCVLSPCETSSCPANPGATCLTNYCGDCNAIYVDGNGDEVDCILQVSPVPLVETVCEMNGVEYQIGETFNDGCNDCTCSEIGQMACTLKLCDLVLPVPLVETVCEMNGVEYQVGDTFIGDCKECTCNEKGFACAVNLCEVATVFLEQPIDSYVVRHTQPVTLTCSAKVAREMLSFECNGNVMESGRVKFTDVVIGSVAASIDISRREVEEHVGDDKFWCQCVAVTDDQQTERSEKAYVVISFIRKEFQQEPASIAATNGDTILLVCSPPTGVPTPTITWEKNDQLLDLSINPRYSMSAEGTLMIDAAETADAGSYVCIVENVAKLRKSRVATVTVS